MDDPYIDFEDRVGLPKARAQALQRTLSDHRTLDRLLRWAKTSTPPRTIESIIVQDEYTHDVVLRSDTDLFLVFDTT